MRRGARSQEPVEGTLRNRYLVTLRITAAAALARAELLDRMLGTLRAAAGLKGTGCDCYIMLIY